MPADKNGDFLRRPPSSIEAEQAVLGAVISNNRALERISEFLRPEHFTEGLHQKIYAAALRLVEKGHLADAITILKFLGG
ncbi:MAG: replicative DNA helicase, partial [Rickettsiales bacterium]|nr:replicative DNA helicase [Rickettsiales bacterium]